MPIYEYRCRKCGTKSTFVTLSVKTALDPACRKCGSREIEKLVSRVSIARSEESRLENLADPSKLSGLDENDPQSLARWMKRMGKEMGDEMGEELPPEFDDMVDRLEAGQSPEEIESALPDVGGDDGGSAGMDADL